MFAVGTERHLKSFEQQAKDDPELAFLLTSLKRERIISEAETPEMTRKLMKEKWKPEFYR